MGVIPEEEWEEFQKVIIQDLPTTFRVSPIGNFSELAQQYLEELSKLQPEMVEGEILEPPRPISWFVFII